MDGRQYELVESSWPRCKAVEGTAGRIDKAVAVAGVRASIMACSPSRADNIGTRDHHGLITASVGKP